MKFKVQTIYCFLLAVILMFNTGCKVNVRTPEEQAKETPSIDLPSANNMSDLVLIYHGGSRRMAHHPAEIKHYVFRDNNGVPEYLFDSFLFLEISSIINGIDYEFAAHVPYRKVPGKSEWSWILDQTFASGRGPDALEATIDSLVKKGFPPLSKRKVVFSIPNPINIDFTWGILDGSPLNMINQENRLKAVKWYIEQVEAKWKSKNYKYIELDSFYWTHEQIDEIHDDEKLIYSISEYLKGKQYDFIWIPYNWAPGAEKWKTAGFTKAYQQPNYFFDLKSEMWILQYGIDFAKKNGMHLEFEFDDRVKEEGHRAKFYDYIEKFSSNGVWDNYEVAYYEGGGGWYQLCISKDPNMKQMAKVLGDIIVERQKRLK